MIRDFVPMKLVPGEEIVYFELGQMIPVFIEVGDDEMKIMMRVVEIYPNGDFDGEVNWGES